MSELRSEPMSADRLGFDTSQVTYCEGWNTQYRDAPVPISVEEARRCHEAGELYCALLGDPELPWAYVDVRLEAKYVCVTNLDLELRNEAWYMFTDAEGIPPGHLWLGQIVVCEFADDSEEEASKGTHIIVGPRSSAAIYEWDGDLEREHETWLKTDGLLVPYPEFGEWEWVDGIERMIPEADIARFEREGPPEPAEPEPEPPPPRLDEPIPDFPTQRFPGAPRLSAKEFEATLRLDDRGRYEYFLRKVRRSNVLWVLGGDEGFALAGDDSDLVALWPHPAYAWVSRHGIWLEYEPWPVPLSEWRREHLTRFWEGHVWGAIFPFGGSGEVADLLELDRALSSRWRLLRETGSVSIRR